MRAYAFRSSRERSKTWSLLRPQHLHSPRALAALLSPAVLFALVSGSVPLAAFSQTPQASPAAVPAGSPAPAAAASPNGLVGGSPPPVADAAITARAKEWLHRVQTGNIDRAQLDAQMNGILTDAAIKGAVAQFGPLGTPTNFTLVDMRTVAGNNAYLYRATFASTALFWLFALDQSGKISGLRFLPAA